VINPQLLPTPEGEPQLQEHISQTVFLLKLTPGLSPEIFNALKDLGYRGIVIEAFGLGGINVLDRGLQGIRNAVDSGISVVVTTQCLYDSSDLQVYQVGNRLLELGVIPGRDMTSEAAVTKLMWALGQGMNSQQIAELFARSIAGEVSV
jgi:L-asparaginase